MHLNLANKTGMLTIAAFLLPASAFQTQAQSDIASLKIKDGYSVRVFATGLPGQFKAPDSLAVTRDRVYIGYGDDHDPADLDGKASQVVEYTRTGQQLFVYNVPGHNDGLKVDPYTGKIWALQDEDGNPNLVIIDPVRREESLYIFAAAPPHGGGYDDIVFRNGQVYFSASNPANNPNNKPALVKAKLVGTTIEVEPVIEGNGKATNVNTGAVVSLNLQDPDSTTVDPQGNILLDSQADSELVLIRKPGSRHQSALLIPLSSPLGKPQVDDTLFTPSADGFLLISDTPANTVYALEKAQFVPGVAFSAGVAAADGSSGTTTGFVAQLDISSGQLAPVVSGLKSPHGLAYVIKHERDYNPLQDICSASDVDR